MGFRSILKPQSRRTVDSSANPRKEIFHRVQVHSATAVTSDGRQFRDNGSFGGKTDRVN